MYEVFSLIREVADRKTCEACAPLLDNLRQCEEVESWLADEESKRAYRKELAFGVLSRLFDVETAVRYAGLVSEKDWEAAIRTMREARQAGLIPDFASGLPDEHRQLVFARTTTFIMNQYEYAGAVGVRQGDTVLDCGACFGESALWARMCGAEKVYSFEPSPSTFSFLKRNAERYDPDGKWFFPESVAVGDKEERLPFLENPEHPGGNGFAAEGGVEVPVVSLDAWRERAGGSSGETGETGAIRPDFIKMDLEGAEGLALLGAEKTFRECKPRFAICLYHKQSDMWTLPRLLKSFVPEYRFWCKKSAPSSEFVLFGSL